jgi:hypothetical protein
MPSMVPSVSPSQSPSVSFQPSFSTAPSMVPSMDPTSSAYYHTAETSVTFANVPGLMKDETTKEFFGRTVVAFLNGDQEFPVPQELSSITFTDVEVLQQTLDNSSTSDRRQLDEEGASSWYDITIRMKVIAVLWRGDPKNYRLQDGVQEYFDNVDNVKRLRNRLNELSTYFAEFSVGGVQRNSQPLSKLGNESNRGFPIAGIVAAAGLVVAITAALILFSWKRGRNSSTRVKKEETYDLDPEDPKNDENLPSFDNSEESSVYPLGARRPKYDRGIYYPTNHIESIKTVDPLEENGKRLFKVENNIEVPETPAAHDPSATKCMRYDSIIPVPSSGSKTQVSILTKTKLIK